MTVQRDARDEGAGLCILDELPAGESRRYRLSTADDAATTTDDVSLDNDGKTLTVRIGDRPVLTYNMAVVPSDDPKEPSYARSGFIHPVYNPSGDVVTDNLAPDHRHQHGIMFAWTNTTFEGRDINFWDSKIRQGRIGHVRLESSQSGAVFASFTAQLRHLDITDNKQPRPVLDETWRVRVYNVEGGFLFDLESTQSCAGESPLRINKYHYGGMMIRGARTWTKQGDDFLTSGGKTRADGNHSRPRWCDIHGTLNGEQTGVMLMDYPENFRHPQPVRLHPKMPYFCYAPLVLGEFTIEPGKPYVSRYRFYVHEGKLDPKQAENHWRNFAEPVAVKVLKTRS